MLEEKIFEDFKQAMKAKDELRKSTLSFLRSQIKNLAIEKRKEKIEDADCVGLIKKEIKRHEDSIEQFKKGARLDLAEKEAKELEILKTYLPAALSEQETAQIIRDALKDFPDATMKDMGNIMKLVMEKAGGRADGALVSGLVKKALTKG